MIVVAVFAICLLGFAAIGAVSASRKKETADDYLLAGRDVPAWLAALSAVATNNSGYMFIGQIGLTYAVGVRSLWLAVGWIVGDAIAWATVYRRLRRITGRDEVRSLPSFLGGPDRSSVVTLVSAALVLAFLGIYAAAQLQAGSKAMTALVGGPPAVGIVVGAVVVLGYSYAGGLRASIWTDAAQSFVMIGAMAALLAWALARIGGVSQLFEELRTIDASLVDPLATDAPWGIGPWALGWVGGGLGVLGQPTILVRTMALRSEHDVPRAAGVYFAWFVPFYVATIAVGLCCRVLLPGLGDPELAMPMLAVEVLPQALIGITLAGVFAATMSTADSQVLSCSAAITEDLLPALRGRYAANKAATAAVAALALAIALFAHDGVFVLVLYAWSGLAVTLGPLVVARAFEVHVRSRVALASMASGAVVAWTWKAAGLDAAIYEIVPGLLASSAVLLAGSFIDPTRAVFDGDRKAIT